MDETECTASNFMPKDLIEIICILERDEKCHSYKIIRKGKYFTLVTKFPAKNGESTPLKNYASGRQTASGFGAQLIGPIQLHVKRQNSSICKFFQDIAWTFFCL